MHFLDLAAALRVIARSEATKQSIVTTALAVDCFASLAMTEALACAPRNDGRTASHFKQPAAYRHGFAFSPRLAREVYLNFPSPDIRGRRECRALDAPAASRAK
jgi:hypothetical protein